MIVSRDLTMDTKITERMAVAYILRHHDFLGLSAEEAAERMGISQGRVNQLLQRMRELAPQLFPILTERQAEVWHYRTVEGLTNAEIAEHLGVAESTIQKTIQRVGHKLGVTTKPHRTTVMDPRAMEGLTGIVQKF